MIPVSTTHSPKVSYIEELEVGTVGEPDTWEFKTHRAEVRVRDWDVTDPDARHVAAEEQLGEGANEDKHYAQHAMWFIDAEKNAAVLIVFRPKVAVA